MADPNRNLQFYASLLRDEIKSADMKVSAAIASSSILLSANFLMLRFEDPSDVTKVMILLASGTALMAVLSAILAVMPRMAPPSDDLFFFRNTARNGAADLLERIMTPDKVNAELTKLCENLAQVITRKYARVRMALHFLMLSAVATTLAVLIRFLG